MQIIKFICYVSFWKYDQNNTVKTYNLRISFSVNWMTYFDRDIFRLMEIQSDLCMYIIYTDRCNDVL